MRWAVKFISVEEVVKLQGQGLEGVVYMGHDVAGMIEFGRERGTLNWLTVFLNMTTAKR